MAIYRLTGKAEKVTVRTGTSEKTGKAWEMRSQGVRANEFVVTVVDLPDDHQGFREGEDVDLIVDVTTRGGFLSTQLRGDWPKPGAHSRAAAA